jgi:hypothetical protein
VPLGFIGRDPQEAHALINQEGREATNAEGKLDGAIFVGNQK